MITLLLFLRALRFDLFSTVFESVRFTSPELTDTQVTVAYCCGVFLAWFLIMFFEHTLFFYLRKYFINKCIK